MIHVTSEREPSRSYAEVVVRIHGHPGRSRQEYTDRNLDIESVSVLMGHSTTRMTETFYSRRKLDTAVNRAAAVWDGTEASEE